MKDVLVLLYIPAAIALFCFAFSGASHFLESKTKNKDHGFLSLVHKYVHVFSLVLAAASIALSLMWFSGEFPDGNAVDRAYDNGYRIGMEAAEGKSYDEGHEDGYSTGYDDGYMEACTERYNEDAAYEAGWYDGYAFCKNNPD